MTQEELTQRYKFENELDAYFINRVIKKITVSCAISLPVPAEQIPEYILEAAQWFWENVEQAVEERYYLIPNRAICQGNKLNKIIKLPPQIVSVFGVHKLQEDLRYGTMGDFSIERMMMSSYSMFGGAGIVGGGMGLTGGLGYSLSDVMMSLYEVDTFDQFLNPPLTFNYNHYSHKLVLLGDLGYSDLIIQTFVRCRIQDLYESPMFFKLVVAYVKQALSTIMGTFEFKYPGGITVNYSNFKDEASDEIQEVKDWAEANRSMDYIFMPKTF